VDFVLCDLHSTAPLLVIELDDRSHARARSESRDRFKDAVLKAAGLPIYRVRCQQAYAPPELAGEIERRIRRWKRLP
jgi:very-short-patch-repair endonuclease